MGLYKVVLETTDERGSRATPEMDRYGKSFLVVSNKVVHPEKPKGL